MTDPHVHQARIPEIPVKGKPLGRHVKHDDRSHDFPAERAEQIVSVRHESVGLPLDQGHLGSCTANALCGAGNCVPDSAKLKHGPFTQKGVLNLYKLETKNEGEPYPPNDPGGTGLEVCKAAQQLGWITSYDHAFGVQHALEALVLRPVITGVSWYDSFDSPDGNGLVQIGRDAQVRGGHEVVVDEIIAERELIGLWNSWGSGYGVGGRFYMSFGTWDALLQQQGDVSVPIF